MAFRVRKTRRKSSKKTSAPPNRDMAAKGAVSAVGHRAAALPLTAPDAPCPAVWQLYEALRGSVPVIDAAFRKIVRLCGGFTILVDDPEAQQFMDRFCAYVSVGSNGCSLQEFADRMLDSLLLYGNAVGEMLFDEETGQMTALNTAHPRSLIIQRDAQQGCRYYAQHDNHCEPIAIARPERILFISMQPPVDGIYGVSVLNGLPAISKVLLRIYECIGQNYDRAGNVRYAVTYRPGNDPASAAYANEHAAEIAAAWQDGIRGMQHGEIQDFIVAGDVEIRAIGAENQMPDTEIPVRQLLEQIVSKLGIPPFLLGLNWSSTERMSAQQADILTSELEYFRRIITPTLLKVARAALHGEGYLDEPRVLWDNINLQDETELAEARLKNAQAYEIELRNQMTETEMRKDNEDV